MGLGCRAQGLGFLVYGLWAQALGFVVYGLRLSGLGLGHWVFLEAPEQGTQVLIL